MIFSHRINFLERLNRTVVDGLPLAERQILGGYNVWQIFQSSIFYNDLRRYGNTKSFSQTSRSSLTLVKDIILLSFVIFISLLAFIKIFLGRSHILIYSIDRTNSKVSKNDTRLDALYLAVKKNHKRFTEIFHAVPERALIERFLDRKRFVLYDSAIDACYSLISFFKPSHSKDYSDINLPLFTDEEKPFVRYLVQKYLTLVPRTFFRIKIYSFILHHSRIEAIYTIDTPRDYSELVLAAELADIPVYAIQHSHYTKYHVGWLTNHLFTGRIAHPSKLYVWSEYWRKELLRLGTYFAPEEIQVAGPKEIFTPHTAKLHHSNITVLIPYEIDANKKEVVSYIKAILDNDCHVIFKTRSDVPEEKQLAEYALNKGFHPHFRVITDTKAAVKESDVVAGTYSTFLYDSVEMLKPVIYLETESDFGEGIALNGLAEVAHGPEDIVRAINESVSLKEEEIMRRRKILTGETRFTLTETLSSLLSSQ